MKRLTLVNPVDVEMQGSAGFTHQTYMIALLKHDG